MSQEHSRLQALIFAEFEGRIAREDREALRAHVESCEGCARLYQRCASAERALSPALGLERNMSRLFEPAAEAPARGRSPVLGLLAASAAAMVAVFLAQRPATDDDLAARGRTSKVDPNYSIRVLGAHEDPTGTPQIFEAKGRALRPGERLLILGSNLGEARILSVLAVLPNGETKVLLDQEKLAGGVEDRQLLPSLEVPAHWGSGKVQVFAVFADRPMQPEELKSELVARDGAGVSIRSVVFELESKEAGR